jgi:hypothetical protein
MTQAPSSASGNESRRGTATIQSTRDAGSAATSFAGSDADAQRRRELALFLKAKRAAVVHPDLGLVDLTYAPLRPRGVTDGLSVVVYSSRAA